MLASLKLQFAAEPSGIDETPQPGEIPAELAVRLAAAKASAVALRRPEAVVIAADTCMELKGTPAGKPADWAAAVAMLRSCAHQTCKVATALHVACGDANSSWLRWGIVRFGACSNETIERSLDASPSALHAEGAFAVDEAGPMLCEEISEDEPGTIAGMPMIALCAALRERGYPLP